MSYLFFLQHFRERTFSPPHLHFVCFRAINIFLEGNKRRIGGAVCPSAYRSHNSTTVSMSILLYIDYPVKNFTASSSILDRVFFFDPRFSRRELVIFSVSHSRPCFLRYSRAFSHGTFFASIQSPPFFFIFSSKYNIV